jgi:transposase
VGTGRTVSEVASELGCDWHTVNDAVTTYGRALLAADKKRLNKTIAIGLDETSFVKLGTRRERDYATSEPCRPRSKSSAAPSGTGLCRYS